MFWSSALQEYLLKTTLGEYRNHSLLYTMRSSTREVLTRLVSSIMPDRFMRHLRIISTRSGTQPFDCPICSYSGVFLQVGASSGIRMNAQCPECGSLERHRLQYLTFQEIKQNFDLKTLSMIHFAPESFFSERFRAAFGSYTTADLDMKGVDFNVDLCDLPFPDSSFDVVYASHVMEHIGDDRKAIFEIHRILRPGGFAILPVPIVAVQTVEYPAANPHEVYHWRAPGLDYYDKYRRVFTKVELYTSEDFDSKYQTYVYEDRSGWPTPEMPLRPPMIGEKHLDIVPVCYV